MPSGRKSASFAGEMCSFPSLKFPGAKAIVILQRAKVDFSPWQFKVGRTVGIWVGGETVGLEKVWDCSLVDQCLLSIP